MFAARVMRILLAASLCGCGGDSDTGDESSPSSGDSGQVSDIACAACDDSCEEVVVIASASHVDGDLTYEDPPPAGGDHNPCWTTWGVHTEPARPENWVHNLEHGGIVLLYDCPDGCAEEITDLVTFTEGRDHALLTPFSGLSGRFAAVAWGHRLVSSCLDMGAVASFFEAHVDRAPESITAAPPRECL